MYLADHIARHWILNRYRVADLRLYLHVCASNGKTHSRFASAEIGVGHPSIVAGLKRLARLGFVRIQRTRGGYHVTAVSQKKVSIPYPPIFKVELPNDWQNLRTLRAFVYATAINAGHFVASKKKEIRGTKNQRSECGAAEVTLAYLAAQLGRDPSTISRQTTLAKHRKWLTKKPRLELIHETNSKADAIECANVLTQDGESVFVQSRGHLWAVCCISQTDIEWLFSFRRATFRKTPTQKTLIRALAKHRKGQRLTSEEKGVLQKVAASEEAVWMKTEFLNRLTTTKTALVCKS